MRRKYKPFLTRSEIIKVNGFSSTFKFYTKRVVFSFKFQNNLNVDFVQSFDGSLINEALLICNYLPKFFILYPVSINMRNVMVIKTFALGLPFCVKGIFLNIKPHSL